MRFIEYMPLDAEAQWDGSQVASAESTLATIAERWTLVPCDPAGKDSAPAERFTFADGIGEIGVVASVTRPFCGTCNRLRLTADGAIRNCLFSDDELLGARRVRERGIRRGVGPWYYAVRYGENTPVMASMAQTSCRLLAPCR